MKNLFRNLLGALLLAIPLLSGSCSKEQQPVPGGADADKAVLDLQIATIPQGTRADTAGDDTGSGVPERERINSLRILLLSADGTLEYNIVADPGAINSEPSAANDYLVYTTTEEILVGPGTKHLFVIANEGYVDSFYFNGDGTAQGKLTDWLASLTPPQSEEDTEADSSAGSGRAADDNLLTQLQSIAFTPDYMKSGNTTKAIPWTTHYETVLYTGSNKKTFYLVPTAAKFTFYFENSMHQTLSVDQLTISSIASDSYLFANVGKSNIRMGGQTWWVDWLNNYIRETLSKTEGAAGDHPWGSKDENGQWTGPWVNNAQTQWITDYTTPKGDHKPVDFIANLSGDKKWQIPSYKDQLPEPETPGPDDDDTASDNSGSSDNTGSGSTDGSGDSDSTGGTGDGFDQSDYGPGWYESVTFYVPESHFSTDATKYAYTMTLKLTGDRNGQTATNTFTLQSLRELFRDTHMNILIRVPSNEEDREGIYAQIVDWFFYPWQKGYVEDWAGDDPTDPKTEPEEGGQQ